jgi:hypothetical protein
MGLYRRKQDGTLNWWASYTIVDEKDLQTAMKNMDALRLRDLIYDPKKSPEIEQFFQHKKELEELEKNAAKKNK